MAKTRILIVEDERIVAEDIKRGLESLGYSVCAIVSSGEEAVRKAGADRPDLVLMDIVLKGQMSGIEAAEQIRSQLAVPIVYLTAYSEEKTLEQAKITEPFGYIIKPFEDRELRSTIEMALYRHKMEVALHKAKKSFHNIVERSADGIIVLDREGVVQFVNSTAVSLFGRKVDELVGEVFGLPLVAGELAEIDIIRSAGEAGVGEMRAVETEWEGTGATLAMIRDISERKKAEEKMKEAIRMKSEFVSTASHELRTPLTAIKEGLRLVIAEQIGKLNDDQKEFLDIAKRNVDRLARLVNNILDVQKLDAGKMEMNLQNIDINEVVNEVKDTMIARADEKGLNLATKIDDTVPKIRFDKDKITQVLTNIVNNAITFTEQGTITITTTNDDNIIQVSVSDTGLGIKKEDLPKVFNEFEQLVSGNERKTGGSGLGLAISKKIIEEHNGKLWADSEPGKGSKFTFTLPNLVVSGV